VLLLFFFSKLKLTLLDFILLSPAHRRRLGPAVGTRDQDRPVVFTGEVAGSARIHRSAARSERPAGAARARAPVRPRSRGKVRARPPAS